MSRKTWYFSDECPIRSVTFKPEVLQVIDEYRQINYKHQPESCGILMGEKTGEGYEYITVTDLSIPQSTDYRTPTFYKRNKAGHQDRLNELHDSSDGVIQYLGEWHTHPQNRATPSSTDYTEWLKTCQYFQDIPVIFFIAGIDSDWLGVQKNNLLYLPLNMHNST